MILVENNPSLRFLRPAPRWIMQRCIITLLSSCLTGARCHVISVLAVVEYKLGFLLTQAENNIFT